MKVLLSGRGGQVGWELQRSLSALDELVALDSDSALNPQGLCGSFTDLAGLAATVQGVQPDVIVNAAAHTAVDKAESEPELARNLNALAPGWLAAEAKKLGAWLVHYSTYYVFDGSGTAPWKETDATGQLSVYGQTRLEGDHAVAINPKHLTLRTSWVYAARGGNFAKTMLRLASERETLTVIDDQVGAPTSAELLADVTVRAIQAGFANPELAGLHHCLAAVETSWHGYASFVLDTAQALGTPLKAGLAQVVPTNTASYPTPARRPLNSRMDTSKLQQAFGLALPHRQGGVARMITEISGK